MLQLEDDKNIMLPNKVSQKEYDMGWFFLTGTPLKSLSMENLG